MSIGVLLLQVLFRLPCYCGVMGEGFLSFLGDSCGPALTKIPLGRKGHGNFETVVKNMKTRENDRTETTE